MSVTLIYVSELFTQIIDLIFKILRVGQEDLT